MYIIRIFVILVIAAVSFPQISQARSRSFYRLKADSDTTLARYEPYAKKLALLSTHLKKQGIEIDSLLNDPRFKIYEGIGNRFKKSAEATIPSLEQYKHIIGYEAKRKEIDKFITTHSGQLAQAEKTYGISKYVISAIIGIESDFGKNTGSYNPFNSYVSMCAVDYREDFAKAQLAELLKFAKRNRIDIFTLKSSYAGAMTYAQFIPYSLNKWFVGKDLTDMNNNILSVANYLSYFKKKTGSIEKAVLRYNPSSLYTNAVLDLAGDAEKSFTPSNQSGS